MAIKPLTTLIKIHKQKTDVLRREMIVLEEELHQLQMVERKLRMEHEQEAQLVMKDPLFLGFFGAYSAYVKKRLQAIAKEMERLQNAIEEKRDEISAEFSEQKKYEIARDHISKRIMEEERRRAQQKYDEVATQQYMRLQESSL
jgi:hypothetical protein